jgi:hypothetical protein
MQSTYSASYVPAIFSGDRKHRYLLSRRVALADGEVLFIMLNPSTANEVKDDPTIRRCMGFAETWGYGILTVCNLFAYVTSDPDVLRSVDDTVGRDNDAYIACCALRAQLVICAWGAFDEARGRDDQVLDLLSRNMVDAWCLGLTKDGYPLHPLYVAARRHPVPLRSLRCE